MFDQLRQGLALARAELVSLSAEAVGGPEATMLLGLCADLSAVAEAGATVAAGRVAATGAFSAAGARSAKAYVSDVCGISPGAAERMLDFAERLEKFPTTARAFREGLVSAAQAEEVTRAAARNAAAERSLLDTAQSGSFSRLRDKANATQSPDPEEDRRRAAAARAGRGLRTWTDADGMGHLHARGPVDLIGIMASRVGSRADQFFEAARRTGEHDAPTAYRFDALVDIILGRDGPSLAPDGPYDEAPGPRPSGVDPDPGAGSGAGSMVPLAGLFDEAGSVGSPTGDGTDAVDFTEPGSLPGPIGSPPPSGGPAPPGRSGPAPPPGGRVGRRSGRPRVDMLIRIDFAALRRGVVKGDELCEVAGIGPIPVTAATEYLGEAALKFVLTNGRDIRAVAHYGRNIRSHLRTALLWKYRRCSVPGCDRALGLEIDHELPVGKGGITSLDNLSPKCSVCHHEKTRRDYPNGTAYMRGRDRKPA